MWLQPLSGPISVWLSKWFSVHLIHGHPLSQLVTVSAFLTFQTGKRMNVWGEPTSWERIHRCHGPTNIQLRGYLSKHTVNMQCCGNSFSQQPLKTPTHFGRGLVYSKYRQKVCVAHFSAVFVSQFPAHAEDWGSLSFLWVYLQITNLCYVYSILGYWGTLWY